MTGFYSPLKSAKKGFASGGESVLGSALGIVLVWWSREYLGHPMSLAEALGVVTICGFLASFVVALARNWWKHCGKVDPRHVDSRRWN